jgi:cholest-4-en-3-one 26-monooxygenase
MEVLEESVDRLSARVVESVAARIVYGVAGRGEIDVVSDIASDLPLAVICEMLGAAESDWPDVFRWSNEVIGGGDPEFQAGRSTRETVRDARIALFGLFQDLLETRRGAPGEDIISALAVARVDGEPLPDSEILNYCFLVILGGNETTRNATSGGVLALIEHPEQQARLRADPSLLPSAEEEILRWTSPIIHFARQATKDVEIRGQIIPAGDQLVMWYPSANRDEEVFAEADVFDVGRTPNEHLAFGGFGEHFCLGANLARLELRTIFAKILEVLEDLELTGVGPGLRWGLVGGIKHLPVSFGVSPSGSDSILDA